MDSRFGLILLISTTSGEALVLGRGGRNPNEHMRLI